MSAAVIALPTAALKKVRQCRSRTKAADRDALLRFPDSYKTPKERQREERWAKAMEADLPSLFHIVMCMGRAMDKSEQRRTALYLACIADATGGPEAAAWFDCFVALPARTYEGAE